LCQNAAAAGSRNRGAGPDSERHFVFATTPLPELRLITVTGNDAHAFLQGQLTQDMAQAAAGRTCLAGWAEPRGRLLWAGHLVQLAAGVPAAFGLFVPAAMAQDLAQQLRRYVLRAKVVVAVDARPVAGIAASTLAAPDCSDFHLAGDPGRALRVGGQGSAVADEAGAMAWELADVRAGLPVIAPATSGEFVPQMVNLDILAGISFSKGCYPGQEIVARTRYLGRVKRRMLRFAAAGSPPAPGAAVHGSRGIAGQVVRAASTPAGATELLAVIVLDDLANPLFLAAAGGTALERLELPYAIPELPPAPG
jgi:tRNA-modifying protein YgfZ